MGNTPAFVHWTLRIQMYWFVFVDVVVVFSVAIHTCAYVSYECKLTSDYSLRFQDFILSLSSINGHSYSETCRFQSLKATSDFTFPT